MSQYEYIYTITDINLSIYDSFETQKPSIWEIMEELEEKYILEERETINTDAIYGLPRVYSKFKCPVGTREKCKSYKVGIFRYEDERFKTKQKVKQQRKNLRDLQQYQCMNICGCVVC